MSISGIQGRILEVTVVGCTKLKDTEWISRQDPYVCVEYASTKYRTRTCKDGGKNPTFQEKFMFTLIEGLRELNVIVWNSNTVSHDDFIGSGKIQLQKVLSSGFDDGSWPLQTKTGRHAGEVRLIMHYANTNKPAASHAPSAPPVVASHVPQAPHFSAPPPFVSSYSQPTGNYPASAPHSSYPPPNSAGYPPPPYYPPQQSAYPSPYPPPPSTYPPASYPPTAHNPHYYPPGSYPPPPPPSYPPPPY